MVDSVLKGLPFLSGRLRNQREKAKKNMVAYAVSSFSKNSRITVFRVSEFLSEEGFEMDESDIRERLFSLSEDGKLDHVSEGEYKVAADNSSTEFDEKMEEIWLDFRSTLSDDYENIDHKNLDQDMEKVFKLFFEETYRSIFESTEDLVESKSDPLSYVDITETLNELIEDYNIHKKGIYRERLLDYLKNPSKELSNFTKILYTATVNYHILKSEKEIDFESIPTDGRVLFYDTNVLVTALCKSKDLNPIVSAVTKRSSDLNFDQYYLPQAANELDELIRMSRREMSDIGGLPPNSEPVENELLEEYYYGDDFSNINEFFEYLSNWKSYCQLTHNLEEYEKETIEEGAVFDWAKATLREFDRVSGRTNTSEKSVENIKLDALLFSTLSKMRGDVDSELDVGPNILSRDNSVLSTSSSGQGHFWDYNVAVHPRQWLNYLLAYSSVKFDEDDWKEISKGILDMATFQKEQWSVEKYSEVLSDKMDYNGDPETLQKFMIKSPRRRDIKRGLREKDGNKVEEAVLATAGNKEFCEAFKNSLKSSERVEKLLDEVKKLRDENDELKSKEGENVISNSIEISPTIDASSDSTSSAVSEATASATSKQEVVDEIGKFIDTLEKTVEGNIEDSDVPNPPDDPSNLEKSKRWLSNFVDYADTAKKASQAVIFLAPAANDILSEISSLL